MSENKPDWAGYAGSQFRRATCAGILPLMTGNVWKVYCALINRLPNVLPGQDTIAKDAGVSRSAVKNQALPWLEKVGLIKRHQRRRDDGSRSSDGYTIDPLDDTDRIEQIKNAMRQTPIPKANGSKGHTGDPCDFEQLRGDKGHTGDHRPKVTLTTAKGHPCDGGSGHTGDQEEYKSKSTNKSSKQGSSAAADDSDLPAAEPANQEIIDALADAGVGNSFRDALIRDCSEYLTAEYIRRCAARAYRKAKQSPGAFVRQLILDHDARTEPALTPKELTTAINRGHATAIQHHGQHFDCHSIRAKFGNDGSGGRQVSISPKGTDEKLRTIPAGEIIETRITFDWPTRMANK